ncbi:patatin family protein [Halobacillus litoralis]|uniref:Patatin family protein n=1 Tax=Halobacillus litoralis TaxID=45668 RepID=A0A845DRA1_9BACI|nr:MULTISPECIES: patatin-like phospholipase family protein [Halobacillus]MCA1023388.1 patatin-like phospholipase family protein [Halobacillus litoralis]MYL19075.1 patatin family protein [Halobacillus litoralis]MYL28223.1 patatin family protein [Halobacillus halophilus]MYL37846.1 patatin family protein [Halobacillus litoralis]
MNKPVVGLALGSGGARGFAHLGVIKVLHDHDIPVDMVAGSSMGALVGSFFAAGQSIEDMYKLALTFKRKYYLDFTVPKMGFVLGRRIKEYIRLFTFGKNIEDFNIPLSIVATDLYAGEKKVFTTGPACDAVRASIAIPGIFVPEKINNRLYVDGGVIDRVPVSVAKKMGADFIIAVDCAHFDSDPNIHSIYDVITQSIDIMQDELVNAIGVSSDADVMIKPDVAAYSSRAFTNLEDIVKAGEKAAEDRIEEIKEKLAAWKELKDHESE